MNQPQSQQPQSIQQTIQQMKPRGMRLVGFEKLIELRCPDCKSLICKASANAIVETPCRKCHNNLYLFHT
jgi:hypothetical protein